MTYKNKRLQKARESILKGRDITEASRVMRDLATAGNGGAAASMLQVLAYQRQWEECIHHCILALNTKDTTQIFSFHVNTQALDVLARAGQETKNWAKIAEFARMKLEELTDYCPPPNSPRYYEDILALCERDGSPPHIRNTGIAPLRKYDGDVNELLAAKAFQRFVDQHAEIQKSADELVFRKFYTALENCYSRGAIELWERERAIIERTGQAVLSFTNILKLSKMYIDIGNDEGAWAVISESLHYWLPLDKCEVLPIVLLADTDIRELMTASRCDFVLNADKTSPRKSHAASR